MPAPADLRALGQEAGRALLTLAAADPTLQFIDRIQTLLGITGSGKTTFARELCRRTGLPYFEMDAFYHGPAWQPIGTGDGPAQFASPGEDGSVPLPRRGGALREEVVDHVDGALHAEEALLAVEAMRAHRAGLEVVEVPDEGHAPLLEDDGVLLASGTNTISLQATNALGTVISSLVIALDAAGATGTAAGLT